MANKLDPMDIRQILSLLNDGFSNRKVGSTLGVSRNTVNSYVNRLKASGHSVSEALCFDESRLMELFPDKSYYSAPYRYIGKQTQIHYTQKHVEVYYNHDRIALHNRNQTCGSYNTNSDHLSSTHKAYMDWNPEHFKNKAAAHGQNVVKCVEQILTSMDYPEIGYKRVIGLLQLHKAYGSDRLNTACRIALTADMVSYSRIKNILENNMDKALSDNIESDRMDSHIPLHDNIRGAASYN